MAAPLTDSLAARATIPPDDRVLVFAADPDLLAGVDARSADLLRHRATARQLTVHPGPWTPPLCDAQTTAGFLILDGLIVRTLRLGGRPCPELLGPGDLLRPWDAPRGSLGAEAFYVARERTTLAVLDAQFMTLTSRWPSITVALLSRAADRSRSLASTLAIAHIRRSDDRLEACLWHLSDRFGHVTPAGVHVPLRLTHELLAQLTCMRRPTASTALGRLCASGRIARCEGGTWLLLRRPGGAAAP
jgi:hypothetical protein